MAKVKFKFDVDGVYQELKYYRSLTPMDTSAMPIPIRSGFTEKEFTDESAPDQDFYVRISTIRSGVEHFSEEVKVTVGGGGGIDPLDEFVTVNLHFTSNGVVDLKGNSWGYLFGTPPLELYEGSRYCLKTNGGNHGMKCVTETLASFGTGDGCLEMLIDLDGYFSRDTALFSCDFNPIDYNMNWFGMTLAELKVFRYGDVAYGSGRPNTEFAHVAWDRKDGVVQIFANGVKTFEASDTRVMNFSKNGLVLFSSGNSSVSISPNGKMIEARVTKGKSRYRDGFAPPTTFKPEPTYTGMWAIASACWGTTTYPQFDMSLTNEPTYKENFSETKDFLAYARNYNTTGNIATDTMSPRLIDKVDMVGRRFELVVGAGAYLNNYGAMDLEFLSDTGAVLAMVRVGQSPSGFGSTLLMGKSTGTLTSLSSVGAYPTANGFLDITQDGIEYIPVNESAATRYNRRKDLVDMSKLKSVRVSNLRAYQPHRNTSTGNPTGSGAYVYLKLLPKV